jgi:phenylalanyl-tRNA synthetase beta chain
MSVMRSNLIGGMIATLRQNLNRGEARIKLFELGRCFLGSDATLEAQPERLGGLVYGAKSPEQWGQDKAERADFFSVKGDVESLLGGLGARFEPDRHPALHPGRTAAIWIGEQRIGFVGELHPKWQLQLELTIAPLIWELSVAAICAVAAPRYQVTSKMPSTRRDIALLVADPVNVQALVDTVIELKIATLVDFSLFDLYRGNTLANGQKSLAFRIVMQDTARTLTDLECDQIVSKIVEVLSQKHGATLRK